MKKIVSLLLTLAMLLGMGSMLSVAAADDGIKVGFARFDFTPDYPAPLAGISARDSVGTLTPEDRVYGTVVAISGADGSTALICTTDLVRTETAWVAPLRQAMSKASGVPESNINISATHTHSSIDTASGTACGIDSPFYETYVDGFAKAAKEAVADLSPVTTKVGTVDIPVLSHIRHYWRQNGHVNGSNFSIGTSGKYLTSITEPDRELQIIRFVREGKKDVLMLNWQMHATAAACLTDYGRAHKQYISADFMGHCRLYLEAQDPDCLVAYYSGASGNATPHQLASYLRDPENVPEDVTVLGTRLGELMFAALKNLKTIDVSGPVKTMRMVPPALDKSATAFMRNSELNAISVGKSIGFVTASGELFCETGKYIKDNSPFEITFVLTQANGVNYYIPAFYSYEYPQLIEREQPIAYEVTVTKNAKGTAEDYAYSMVAMLNALYK